MRYLNTILKKNQKEAIKKHYKILVGKRKGKRFFKEPKTNAKIVAVGCN